MLLIALSQAMYLFKANLKLLANTSTHEVAKNHLEQNLTASCLHCWSAGLTEREIPMQYYAITQMQVCCKCTESQVCNDCTYRWNSSFEVLSEDVILSIYFRVKFLNTLQNNMNRMFRTVLFIMSFMQENLLKIFIVRYQKDLLVCFLV